MAAESKTKHIINLILRYTVLILVGFVIGLPFTLDGWSNF